MLGSKPVRGSLYGLGNGSEATRNELARRLFGAANGDGHNKLGDKVQPTQARAHSTGEDSLPHVAVAGDEEVGPFPVDWELVADERASPEVIQKRKLLFQEALGAPCYSRHRQVLRIMKGMDPINGSLWMGGQVEEQEESTHLFQQLKGLYDSLLPPTLEEKALAVKLEQKMKSTQEGRSRAEYHDIEKANEAIADLLLMVRAMPSMTDYLCSLIARDFRVTCSSTTD